MQASGFVLAGGRSTRMGRNKALLPFHGMTLVEHVAGMVREATGSVTLIGDPVQLAHLGLPVVADKLPGAGPAAGIYTALTITSSDWNLIAGCDMPAITCDILLGLLRRAAMTPITTDCLAAAGPNGEPEPLCAVYHRRCLAAVARAIREKRLKMKDLLAEFRIELTPVDPASLANVNTPAEWAEFEEKGSSGVKLG
jgi:molybdopterin-guanine dinucleotide biosynthesis protein A